MSPVGVVRVVSQEVGCLSVDQRVNNCGFLYQEYILLQSVVIPSAHCCAHCTWYVATQYLGGVAL